MCRQAHISTVRGYLKTPAIPIPSSFVKFSIIPPNKRCMQPFWHSVVFVPQSMASYYAAWCMMIDGVSKQERKKEHRFAIIQIRNVILLTREKERVYIQWPFDTFYSSPSNPIQRRRTTDDDDDDDFLIIYYNDCCHCQNHVKDNIVDNN